MMCLKEAFCPRSRHGLHSARRTSPSLPTTRAEDRLGALLRHRQAIRLANAPHPQGLHELALLSPANQQFQMDTSRPSAHHCPTYEKDSGVRPAVGNASAASLYHYN